jgi:hypothetical protein
MSEVYYCDCMCEGCDKHHDSEPHNDTSIQLDKLKQIHELVKIGLGEAQGKSMRLYYPDKEKQEFENALREIEELSKT